ncbi:hypothetical protein D3C72_1992200 [compost metagenome]
MIRLMVSARLSASQRWRRLSIRRTNSASLPAVRPPPAPHSACHRLTPCSRLAVCRFSTLRAPMPRAGTLITRNNALSSSGLATSRR